MTLAVSGTAITFPDASTQNTAPTGYGFKNRIINGAMVFDQRKAGASVTPTADNTYTLDRWKTSLTQASKFSVQQTPSATETGYEARVAAGFTSYLAATSLSSYSVLTGDYFAIDQRIEGYNVADLGWGTASAKTVTLSFLVYSSLTGTFGGALSNSAFAYSYPFTYTVSTANTWTQVSVTIPGPTAGVWVSGTNGIGMRVYFGLGVGSTYSGTAGSWAASGYISATGATSVVGTSGAKLYITGVQLEKGSTATSFDYRPYGTELQLCQRYCQTVAANFHVGYTISAAVLQGGGGYVFPTTMRAAPTLTGGAYTPNVGAAGTVAIWYASTNSINLYNQASNWNTGAGVYVSTGAVLSSEL